MYKSNVIWTISDFLCPLESYEAGMFNHNCNLVFVLHCKIKSLFAIAISITRGCVKYSADFHKWVLLSPFQQHFTALMLCIGYSSGMSVIMDKDNIIATNQPAKQSYKIVKCSYTFFIFVHERQKKNVLTLVHIPMVSTECCIH